MRLNEALTEAAVAAGVRIVNGARTVGVRVEDGVVKGVTVATAGAAREYLGDAFVLATGGFEAGALALDSFGAVTETLFGLPLAGAEGPLIHGDYWGAEQPLFKVGVRVAKDMRVVDGSGAVVHPNLFAAGGDVYKRQTRSRCRPRRPHRERWSRPPPDAPPERPPDRPGTASGSRWRS